MPYLLPIPMRPSPLQHFAFKEAAFTPEECEKIIALVGDNWQRALVGGGAEDGTRRRSDVAWLNWNANDNWLWDKLADWTTNINQQFFGFELGSFAEALQVTRYRSEEQGHYSWHQDIGAGTMSIRKLSFVVQLTDPAQYTGGALDLFMAKVEKNISVPNAQGTIVFFPSYEPHRVTPVKSGVRHSLVGWVSGIPFR